MCTIKYICRSYVDRALLKLYSRHSLSLDRGLKTELLCTTNPSTQLDSCRPLASYAASELSAIERESIPAWSEYGYFPDFVAYWLVLWACFLFAEQQTISLMMVIKSSYTAVTTSVACTILYLVLGSGTVR